MNSHVTLYQHKEQPIVWIVFTACSQVVTTILGQERAWPGLRLEKTYPWAMTPCRWFPESELKHVEQIGFTEVARLFPEALDWIKLVFASYLPDRYADVKVGPLLWTPIVAQPLAQQIPFRTWFLPSGQCIIMVEHRLKAQLDAIADLLFAQVQEAIDLMVDQAEKFFIRLDGMGSVSVYARDADAALALAEGHVFLTTDNPRITVENAGEWNFEVADVEEGA
jgi:hypothetical protein